MSVNNVCVGGVGGLTGNDHASPIIDFPKDLDPCHIRNSKMLISIIRHQRCGRLISNVGANQCDRTNVKLGVTVVVGRLVLVGGGGTLNV